MKTADDCCKCQEFEPLISEEKLLDISKASTSNYFLVFAKNPDIIYFIQDFTLPGTNNRMVSVPVPMADPVYKVAGVANDYDDLNCSIMLDESFHIYFNLLKWMRENERKPTFRETTSEASLFILNNAKTPIIEVRFHDIFPVNLGPIQFMNSVSDTIVTDVTFANHHYEVKYLDGSDYIGYMWENTIAGPPSFWNHKK